MNYMVGRIASEYLCEPLLHRCRYSVNRRTQVAVGQRVQQLGRRRHEIVCDGRQPALLRLDRSPCVVGHELAHDLRNLREPPQVSGPIDGVETCRCQRRGITNVVEPCRYLDQLGLLTQHSGDRPRSICHTLSVGPASRKLLFEESPRDLASFFGGDHPSDATSGNFRRDRTYDRHLSGRGVSARHATAGLASLQMRAKLVT